MLQWEADMSTNADNPTMSTSDDITHGVVWAIGFGGRRILRCHGCGMSITRSHMLFDEDMWQAHIARFVEAHS